jgi:hypothetical protein
MMTDQQVKELRRRVSAGEPLYRAARLERHAKTPTTPSAPLPLDLESRQFRGSALICSA